MDKEIMKQSEIINEALKLPPEQMGIIVSALIELLEEIYDYDFNKIIDTIKRCHNKRIFSEKTIASFRQYYRD